MGKLPRFLWLLLGLLGWLGYRLRWQLLAQVAHWSPPRYRVKTDLNLHLVMRDGVILAADHYLPSQQGIYPTILIRSPYGRGLGGGVFGLFLSFFAYRFAERGYHVITQDTRGRFDSGGEFFPYFNEQNDGLDTLAWIKKQDWYGGKIGLWGPSYLGIVQWAIAAHDPDIQALVPSATSSELEGIIFPDGAFDMGLAMRWITIFDLLDRYRHRSLPASAAILPRLEHSTRQAFGHVPILEADAVTTGGSVDYYRYWLDHTEEHDPAWEQTRAEICLPNVTAPVHLVAGWYDFFLRGQLQDYQNLKAAGRQPYLTIGAWYHLQPDNPMGMFDSFREGIDWFEAHLKGHKQRMRPLPVKIFVMGVNQWRDLPDFPPPAQTSAYFLRADGRLDTKPERISHASRSYRYDPADPTPSVGGAEFSFQGGAHDVRGIEARSDVLVYTSPVLRQPLEIIGYVQLKLYVHSSLIHADFHGRLCDVHPGGKVINLCEGLYRIEPGKGESQPDGTILIEIDLWATAHRFLPGHALRLHISSGAHPHWERNHGTGSLLDSELRPADQTIFHDAGHHSALLLPVIEW